MDGKRSCSKLYNNPKHENFNLKLVTSKIIVVL